MPPRDRASTAVSAADDLPAPGLAADVKPVPPRGLTMKEIRSAIPAHCFERSTAHSLRYLAQDLLLVAGLACAIRFLDTSPAVGAVVPRWVIACAAWPMYWWWQGAVMTGIWVLSHEAGHQAFSPSKAVNDAVGLVFHSALLVPYHSWRITHSTHHKNTNRMEMDQVFVPPTKEEYLTATGATVDGGGKYAFPSPLADAFEESPIGDWLQILRMFTVGWPAYLAMNVAGQDYGPGSNHFNPRAKMFSPRDYWDVVVSDVGILAALACIGAAAAKYGAGNVAYYYFVPYLFTNMWLVLYTYLQHSCPSVPHYRGAEWTFLRGALCSVDRDYGIYNVIHHQIGSKHVAHHLFSQMPFYHTVEATEALKKVLGPYYNYDDTPIITALMRSWSECKYVDPSDGEVMYFRSLKGSHTRGKSQ
jgi:omega-6 fatty acid desaturase / acyl-lipid omega-6 desaturase (Delta-12 desaturase)